MCFLQTVAILAELGPQRLLTVLGVEDEQICMATYSLLQVIFDALKEGLQRDVRGKDEALVLGESLASCRACGALSAGKMVPLVWETAQWGLVPWN